jgi:hypothetical protein
MAWDGNHSPQGVLRPIVELLFGEASSNLVAQIQRTTELTLVK